MMMLYKMGEDLKNKKWKKCIICSSAWLQCAALTLLHTQSEKYTKYASTLFIVHHHPCTTNTTTQTRNQTGGVPSKLLHS